MLAKSFVGSRAEKLFSVKSLRELYGLLFDDEVPAVPESMLAKIIETKAQDKFVSQYTSLLENYSKPDEVLITLLRSYDYENLKEIGAALCYKESAMPDLVDIGSYSRIGYKYWPDLSAMTANSSVSWYNKPPKSSEQQEIDQRLDRQYIAQLWESAKAVPMTERDLVLDFVRREVVYQNIMWALRLKVFFKYDADIIAGMLFYENDTSVSGDNRAGAKNDLFARDALAILDKDTDSWDAWSGWKYADFLNPHEDGVVWEIDPCWVENLMRRDLNQHALRAFHKNPDTAMVLFSWFKIKQNELGYIRSVAEGLRMNVDADEVLTAAGATVSSAK
ncbi:MAG: V-type ATPase subunit [Treponema sp.]|nr:V-type ATPase subunit [Treponema sp.]